MRRVRLGEVLSEDGEGGGEGEGSPAANSSTGPGMVYPERGLGAPAAKRKKKPDAKGNAKTLMRQMQVAEAELRILFPKPEEHKYVFKNAKLLARQTGRKHYVYYGLKEGRIFFTKNLAEARGRSKAYLEFDWGGKETQWVLQSEGWGAIVSE